ncbi:MAG TPA: tripartite tricarboxylate transporter substrate binding protein [Candidatus Binatia bacterium]|nr:tripartite tricarboxylate transporter substrate binding protein [Candidatus Binatia bacterium]
MKPSWRFLSLAFSAALLFIAAGGALAQNYPTKPITMIVPFPPGGTTDILARTVGQKLTEAWGQQTVVDNRPGAGATLGAGLAAKASPDGYTVLMGAVHHTIAPGVYKKLPYDFQKDFAPITIVAEVPNVLVVNPSLPAKTVKELIAHAKANPGKLTYGSNGLGTAHHVIGENFKLQAGVDIVHVPYKGSGPAVTDLLGGQISMMFDTVTSALPHIKAGKLRPLAVTTAKRSTALPDVPTLAEAALPGFDIGSWFGVLAPVKTPKEITAKLNAEIVKILNMPDVKNRLLEIGAEPVGNTPEQMAARIKEETVKFAQIAKQANVTLE